MTATMPDRAPHATNRTAPARDTRPTVRVSLAALREALARVARVIPSRATLPIMQCVRLTEAEDGAALTLDATNLDAYVRTTCALDHGPTLVNAEPLRVAVPASALASALQHATADEATLTLVSAARVAVKIGRATYQLAGLPPDDMVEFRGVAEASAAVSTAARVPAGVLLRAIRRVQHAASTEPSRPTLNGVHLERLATDPGVLHAVAFNGHRLASVRVPLTGEALGALGGDTLSAIVPTMAVAALPHLFDGDELVAVALQDNMLRVASDRSVYVARLVDGEFTAWRPYLRADSPLAVEVERAGLLAAVERVAFAADSAAIGKESHRAIGLTFTDADGGTCRVWASSDGSSAVDSLACVVPAGAEITLGVNAHYLADALAKLCTGPRARLAFDTPRSPIQCTDPDDADALAIVSPLASPPHPTED